LILEEIPGNCEEMNSRFMDEQFLGDFDESL
jgi:hypothetical protein